MMRDFGGREKWRKKRQRRRSFSRQERQKKATKDDLWRKWMHLATLRAVSLPKGKRKEASMLFFLFPLSSDGEEFEEAPMAFFCSLSLKA